MENQRRHEPESVLVTGGAGFIGSNYLLRMVRSYPEVGFVNLDALTYAGNLANLAQIEGDSNFRFVRGDIADGDLVDSLFEQYRFTTVVHFAAESHVDRSIEAPLSFVRTNVTGTTTLLEAARRHWTRGKKRSATRFHHISTDEVFGTLGAEGFFSEATPYAPRSPYAASKASSDHFVRAYAETYNLPVVLSNASNNYGPYQFPEKLIPLVISNALNLKPIPVYGKGENVRDWMYVEDHCEALETILHHGADLSTYLVGAGNEVANLDLVHRLVDLVDAALARPEGQGRDLIRFVEDRPGHDFRYALDVSLIRDELGWSPRHSLSDGLKKTVDWYLSNKEWLESLRDESYLDYYDRMYAERLSSGGS